MYPHNQPCFQSAEKDSILPGADEWMWEVKEVNKRISKAKEMGEKCQNIDTTHDSGVSERPGYICMDDLKWKSNGKAFESHRK